MLNIVLWCPSGDSHLDNDNNLLSYLPLENGTYFTFKVKNTASFYSSTLTFPWNKVKRKLKQRWQRRQRKRQKSKRFRLAKQQLCTCIKHFLYISLPSWDEYNVKVPKFTSFVEDGNTRQQLSFSFPEFWYSPLEFNFKNICQHLTK